MQDVNVGGQGHYLTARRLRRRARRSQCQSLWSGHQNKESSAHRYRALSTKHLRLCIQSRFASDTGTPKVPRSATTSVAAAAASGCTGQASRPQSGGAPSQIVASLFILLCGVHDYTGMVKSR